MHRSGRARIDRRDKRGRRIGYNWWREYIMEMYSAADAAWLARRESGQPIHSSAVAGADYDTGYYQLSDDEYRRLHPRPTLKEFLIEHAGQADQDSERAA